MSFNYLISDILKQTNKALKMLSEEDKLVNTIIKLDVIIMCILDTID